MLANTALFLFMTIQDWFFQALKSAKFFPPPLEIEVTRETLDGPGGIPPTGMQSAIIGASINRVTERRSFIWIRNMVGDKMQPWGTPDYWDKFIFTSCSLHFLGIKLTPKCWNNIHFLQLQWWFYSQQNNKKQLIKIMLNPKRIEF